MFLSRFRVRGYKCLEDVDLALTPIHVLIGPADSGKTSLLEAISAFYGRLKTPPSQWFPAVASPRELITHGSSVPAIDLAGQWSEMPQPGRLPLSAAGYGYSILVPEKGTALGITDQWVRPRAGKDPQSGLARAATAYPHNGPIKEEDRAAQAAFHDCVQTMLQPAPVLRLDPRRLAEPSQPAPSRFGPLAADGYGLPLLLDEIAQRNPERHAEIRTEFCRILPQYRNLDLTSQTVAIRRNPSRARKSESEEPTARGLVFETCSARKVAASDVSAGALLLLAMLTMARLPEPPPLLLIENPEQGLYPQWLGDVMGSLRQAASWPEGRPYSQIILTTHSPAVLDFFQPEEVTLLSRPGDRPDGPAVARPLQSIEQVRRQMIDGATRLGELWREFSL